MSVRRKKSDKEQLVWAAYGTIAGAVPRDQPPSWSSAACIDAHSPWLTLLTCTATCGSSTLHACLSEDVLNELVRQSNHRDHWRASKCNGRVWFHVFFICFRDVSSDFL